MNHTDMNASVIDRRIGDGLGFAVPTMPAMRSVTA